MNTRASFMMSAANRAGNDEEDVFLGESENTELELGRRGGRATSNFRLSFGWGANRAGNDEEEDFLGEHLSAPDVQNKY